MKKRKVFIIAVIALILIGVPLLYAIGAFTKNQIDPEMIYKMVLCPCCGKTIDTRCCPMAQERREFVNLQASKGLSEKEILVKVAERYGLTSLTGPQKSSIEAEFAKQNPDMFPKEKLSFQNAIGQKAPDFQLETLDGSKVKLSNYKGKTVVLFFTEGSMCYPACWNQIEEFGKDSRFNSNEVQAFSVVVDQKSEWQKIRVQVPEMSKAKLLFDTTRGVSSAYDSLSLPSSMHKGQFPGHTYFIIDKEGVIKYAMDDPDMAIRDDLLFNQIEKLR